MYIATEIVTMKSMSNVTKDEFISIVDGLEKNFHSKQPGFVDTELLYDEQNNLWVMIQHWESIEQLKAASKKMFKNSATESFINALDTKSIKMTIAPQIKKWS